MTVKNLESEHPVADENLPADLTERIKQLREKEKCYWEDELYSPEALTNMTYRTELERCFNLDPLGNLPPRQ